MLLKTQDVPLDGTIFFGNTGQKDKATSMNKNQSINQSTLFKHGKWLNKLVFRHAV